MNTAFPEHATSPKAHLAEVEQVDDIEGTVIGTEQRSLNSMGVDILRLIFEQVFSFRNQIGLNLSAHLSGALRDPESFSPP